MSSISKVFATAAFAAGASAQQLPLSQGALAQGFQTVLDFMAGAEEVPILGNLQQAATRVNVPGNGELLDVNRGPQGLQQVMNLMNGEDAALLGTVQQAAQRVGQLAPPGDILGNNMGILGALGGEQPVLNMQQGNIQQTLTSLTPNIDTRLSQGLFAQPQLDRAIESLSRFYEAPLSLAGRHLQDEEAEEADIASGDQEPTDETIEALDSVDEELDEPAPEDDEADVNDEQTMESPEEDEVDLNDATEEDTSEESNIETEENGNEKVDEDVANADDAAAIEQPDLERAGVEDEEENLGDVEGVAVEQEGESPVAEEDAEVVEEVSDIDDPEEDDVEAEEAAEEDGEPEAEEDEDKEDRESDEDEETSLWEEFFGSSARRMNPINSLALAVAGLNLLW
eukprot:GHVN01069908.1.p1 GENE.GHVN01069908.1~~GHVN01069908.1.p1  ORF type:complete len:417 (-),score=97.94 GHVN01069908.1:186-1379(-)